MIRRSRPKILPTRRTEALRAYTLQVQDAILLTLQESLPDLDPMVLEDLAEYIEEDLRAARLLKSPRVRGTPEACEKCERPLRAKNPTAAKQYPDRVAHAGYGLCTACYQYEEGGVVDPMPSHCAACKKPVRHRSVPKEERPEAVGYHGRGICQTCYRKRRDDLKEAG